MEYTVPLKVSRNKQKAISGCPKTKNISDNTLIWGNTLPEQNNNLKKLLE